MLPIGARIAGFERWRLGPRGKSPLVQALLFGELNKPFKPARTPFDWLSRDPAEVDKYIADPLCGFDGDERNWRSTSLGALARSRRRRRPRREDPEDRCRSTSSAARATPSAPSCKR